MKLAAIILAAGNSNRFKSNTPKQFHFYNKDIILNHSIKKFEKIKEIKGIYIALSNKYQKKYSPFVKKTKKIKFFNGGKYRSESAKKGIKKLYQNYTHVLIHDAARPNFTIKLVLKLIKELKKNSCVVPAITSSDTTVYEKKYVDRSKIKDAYSAFITAGERLKMGINMCIFPEGGIPKNDILLKKLKNGPFRLAIEQKINIVPITMPDNKNGLFSPRYLNFLTNLHF